jgi:hypothetical protein
MMLTISRTTLIAAALAIPIYGQNAGNDKPDLNGSWRLETKTDASAPTSVIQQNADEIRIREPSSSGEKAVTDVKCGVKGKECAARVNGDDAHVTFWYNGQTLVQMTTQGKDVVKTRRTLSADGRKMTVEIIPIAPSGKTETLTFARAEVAEQRPAPATQ